MNTNEQNEAAVKNAILELIQAGTTFDVDALEKIYHNSLQVISIDIDGNMNVADKAAFKRLFETKKSTGAAPLNTWAEFNHIEAKEDKGHVLISRKVNLVDQDQYLVLSIDLIHEDGRWQVIREVIFARPEKVNL